MPIQASVAPTSGQSTSTPESFCEEKWRETKESYTSYHMMAWESILMQAGETWVKWDASRKVFTPDAPADDWTPTPKVNRFAPTIDAIVANVMTVPEVEATPKGSKSDVQQWGIADVASRLADDWLGVAGLRAGSNRDDDKAGEAGMAFVLCGSVFTEVQKKVQRTHSEPAMAPQPVIAGSCPQCNQYYDDLVTIPGTMSVACPTCNVQIQDARPSVKLKPVVQPDGQPQMNTFDVMDADCQIGLPIYAHPRVGSKGMSDCDYFFWAERRTINQIKTKLQIDDASPDDEQVDGFSVGYEHALAYFYQGVSQTTKANKDSALVVTLYVPPNRIADFPEGFKAIMINNDVKKVDPWDYGDNDHCFTYAVYQRLLTLFFGRSVAFELAGIQKEYQQYESLIKLHAMTSAVDSIIVDSNTQVTAITGRADKIIKWRSIGPGSKEPHRMQHGSLDDGIYKQRQSLRDEFENVSGAVGVYRGMQPGSVTAASAIGKLQTQAEMMFSKPVQNWNGLWKETVRKAVKIRQQCWTEGMIAQVVGKDRLTQIRDFKNCDLDRTVDWVATAHGLPRSREEKKSEFIELFDRGALDLSDPAVREKAFELFGDSGVMNNFNLDATRARVENDDLKAGMPVRAMPEIEDLAVHLAIHRECAKKLDFDEWPEPSKTLMIQHIMETMQMQQEMAMAQAATAAPPESSSPGPAGGGNSKGPHKPGPDRPAHPRQPGPVKSAKSNPGQPAPPTTPATPTAPPGAGA